MALYHKWDVKNDFVYMLKFVSLISDNLGSVYCRVPTQRVSLKAAFIIAFLCRYSENCLTSKSQFRGANMRPNMSPKAEMLMESEDLPELHNFLNVLKVR